MISVLRKSAALFAILYAAAGTADAAEVSFRSPQFSASRPVPHLHFEGPVVPGDLARIAAALDQHTTCSLEVQPAAGENCAVLTMRSEGGNYIEGLSIARLLRNTGVATWVESDSYCYSACAFAFLGGSGYGGSQVGAFIDRTIEPGAVLGFHAPYVASDTLGTLVAELGLEQVLGGSRESIALMIQELVHWNVDKSVLAHITNMGAEEAYVASTPQHLYLLRIALPDAPRQLWAPDPAHALRNACTRLIAYHYDMWPFDVAGEIRGEIAYNFSDDDKGQPLTGYLITDRPSGLTVSYCATATSEAHLGADADVALYFGTGVDGYLRRAVTFFHRPEGWSTLGTGGTSAQRILQKGAISHYFMDAGIDLSSAYGLIWNMSRAHLFRTGKLPR